MTLVWAARAGADESIAAPAVAASVAAAAVPAPASEHTADREPAPDPTPAPASAASVSVPAPSPCPETGDVVTVVARKRELWLCREGAAVGKFQVALGRGGLDKRRKGDGRTPIGTYTLGTPRPSSRFGIFIPIDYPTPDQAANGFTGSAVGIHGPPRGLTEPVYPTTVIDWTQGCIATGVDEDIGVIAEFVRARQPLLVVR